MHQIEQKCTNLHFIKKNSKNSVNNRLPFLFLGSQIMSK